MLHRWTHQLVIWAVTLSMVGLPWLYAATAPTGRPLSVTDADFVNVDPATQSGWTQRIPTTGEKAALAGSSGTPSGTNRYVTSAEKGTAGGPATLGSDSMLTWTQLGSRDTHAPLAAASQITPTATTMAIEGTTPVTMTTGNPRITGCTTAVHDGRLLVLKGSHPTNTVTMPNGQGVRLAGNTGSLTFGRDLASALFVCDGSLLEWQQVAGGGLPSAWAMDNAIVADETRPLVVQNAAGTGRLEMFVNSSTGVPSTRGICGGVPCPTTTIGPVPAGGAVQVTNNSSVAIWKVDEATGLQHGPGAAPQTLCYPLSAVTGADDGMVMGSIARAITITNVWCIYGGTAPTTAATFALKDGANNAMSHTAPVCQAKSATGATISAAKQAVTGAAAILSAFEAFMFDVTNTPNPATDTYTLCVQYQVTD